MSERLRVALTFDAEHPDRPGAAAGTAERIVRELDGAGVRATFFIQSRWAMANPELTQAIAREGHLVGNHSMYHARMSLLSDEGIRTDVSSAAETIVELSGVDPRPWFRCPFGDGRDDGRVTALLEDLGYRNVHWHVELGDWEPDTTAADIARGAVEGSIGHGDGVVVLLHTWPQRTADALPAALRAFNSDGVSFVTIDELEVLP